MSFMMLSWCCRQLCTALAAEAIFGYWGLEAAGRAGRRSGRLTLIKVVLHDPDDDHDPADKPDQAAEDFDHSAPVKAECRSLG